jgi:hypothetical protein
VIPKRTVPPASLRDPLSAPSKPPRPSSSITTPSPAAHSSVLAVVSQPAAAPRQLLRAHYTAAAKLQPYCMLRRPGRVPQPAHHNHVRHHRIRPEHVSLFPISS